MSCLIEGWFQLTNARPFADNPPDATATSPRKTKSYLTLYDSCAALGSIASRVWIDSELRIYNQNLDIEDQVIHIHGRFSVLPADEDKGPCLQVEVHQFVLDPLDLRGTNLPVAHRTSATVFGCVASATEVTSTADKFFMLEAGDYIWDHNQTFNIHCRLNRTTSRRWDNVTVPTPGMTILISGSLEGENSESLRVDVETMQFITPTRGIEVAGLPPMPGRSKFGLPTRAKAKGNTSDPPSSSPLIAQDKQSPRPLSMLPVPTLTSDEAQAGPSTPSPSKRTRAAAKPRGKVAGATSSELTTADKGDDSPVAKKKQKSKSKAA